MSWSTSELRVRLVHCETSLSPPVKYFYWPFQGGASFVDHLCYSCLLFVMLSCKSVCWYIVVTCWERAELLALVCVFLLWRCHFPIGHLGQVWCLIVWIPDLCPLSYFHKTKLHQTMGAITKYNKQQDSHCLGMFINLFLSTADYILQQLLYLTHRVR